MKLRALRVDGKDLELKELKNLEVTEYFEPEPETPYWEFYFSDKSAMTIMASNVVFWLEDMPEDTDIKPSGEGEARQRVRMLRRQKEEA